ncbi:MAG: glycosyltransferase family 4 protein [Clostridiales bacterium]|nr:glycosyltransferase family 4 protein [Clostridiales bacterium]
MIEIDKFNIAMVGQKAIPSRAGGVEVVVEELSTAMVRQGHQVACYNRYCPGVDQSAKEMQGVRLKTVFTIPKRGLAALTSSVSAAVLAALGRYQIVHFHAEGPCAMLWLPKLFGKTCIATIHGLDWQRSKWGNWAARYLRLGEWVAVKCADEIIVLSASMQRYFWEEYGRKTVYIPNGIRPMPVRPARLITERWQLAQGEYFLFLGRIVPEKGIQYLIKAFRKVNTTKCLVIAGGASDTEDFYQHLREMAGGDPRVIFTDAVQGATLEELYSNAYLYCLPSDLEGMPLSLLEAMSYGLCCVTSDLPECLQITGSLGYQFPKGDVDRLRDVLQMLVDRPELTTAHRKEIMESVCTRYSWEDTVEQTLNAYRKARAPKGRRAQSGEEP